MCRDQGRHSTASDDEEEQEAFLQQPLSANLAAASPFLFTSAAVHSDKRPCASMGASKDKTALGVVAMLRRLRLWTKEDPKLGKLTLLPKNIAKWLHSTNK